MPRKSEIMLVQMTLDELLEAMKERFPVLGTQPVEPEPKPEEEKKDGPTFQGRLLYGIKGIEDFFRVSHRTAHEWKESWLKPAVKQRGRKIVTYEEYAMMLFSKQPVAQSKKVGRKRG